MTRARGKVDPPLKLRYRVGARVRVLDRGIAGHKRTPAYVRGKVGSIERYCGEFRNPESLAYGGDGLPKKQLYRIHFRQRHLWPDYRGADADTLEIEIYEHWLEPA